MRMKLETLDEISYIPHRTKCGSPRAGKLVWEVDQTNNKACSNSTIHGNILTKNQLEGLRKKINNTNKHDRENNTGIDIGTRVITTTISSQENKIHSLIIPKYDSVIQYRKGKNRPDPEELDENGYVNRNNPILNNYNRYMDKSFTGSVAPRLPPPDKRIKLDSYGSIISQLSVPTIGLPQQKLCPENTITFTSFSTPLCQKPPLTLNVEENDNSTPLDLNTSLPNLSKEIPENLPSGARDYSTIQEKTHPTTPFFTNPLSKQSTNIEKQSSTTANTIAPGKIPIYTLLT